MGRLNTSLVSWGGTVPVFDVAQNKRGLTRLLGAGGSSPGPDTAQLCAPSTPTRSASLLPSFRGGCHQKQTVLGGDLQKT